MDVNGTRFHLIKGNGDWSRCCEHELCPGSDGQHRDWNDVHLDTSAQTVTLNPLLSLFKHRGREVPLSLSSRRGAAVDRFGNRYWISNDRKSIHWLSFNSKRPMVYWSQPGKPACPQTSNRFEPAVKEQFVQAELAGMAITEHHYLVAGNRTERGFFIFDLDAGGDPVSMLFPEGVAFDPWDMAAAPGGGVWILDRVNRLYWGLDRQFRVVAEPVIISPQPVVEPPAFTPLDGAVIPRFNRQFPQGFQVDAIDPVSIESVPDGSVLILDSPGIDSPAITTASTLHHYRLNRRESPPIPIEAQVEVMQEGSEAIDESLAVVGYDIAYVHQERALYVVERDGNQAIVFTLDLEASPPQLSVSRDYLPLHFFGGRAAVTRERQVFYDVVGGDPSNDAAVRWAPLHMIDQPRYEREGALFTPVLDGKERDCVWHRFFVDACIPAEAHVRVWSRAHNDRELLMNVPFTREPDMYLRSSGAEIPFYNPFQNLKSLTGVTSAAASAGASGTGTWELAFQRAAGRFMQIKIELTGNGRVTPHLHALRIYYPRFSYPKRYLPAVYQEDAESAGFLERLLANMEGFFADIEGKIGDARLLFDARSAPPETLDWLANWLGLVLDPLWSGIQEHRAETSGAGAPAPDRRRLFIRFARKLYNARGTPDGIRFALHLLLDPCLERTVERFRTAALRPDLSLRDELSLLGLPYPEHWASDEQIEDLVYDYLLAPNRPTKIRVVERFLTRGGRAIVEGDPGSAGSTTAAGEAEIEASAHRFSVLVPEGLIAEEEAMVNRVVDLEKPAHTHFDVGRYWDFFRVGETRLGLDTVLGEESRFSPLVVGRDYLGESYLHPPNPMDVKERVISDRDRVGFLPGL